MNHNKIHYVYFIKIINLIIYKSKINKVIKMIIKYNKIHIINIQCNKIIK